ncbi:MAG: glycoside hydrolase family 6 protein [Gemmatimonadaceae bacterium]
MLRRSILLAALALSACSDLATAPHEAKGGKKNQPAAPVDSTAPATAPAPTTDSTSTTTSGNLLAGMSFYADPASSARKTADAWRASRPADAAQMDKIAAQPQARWFGNWNSDVQGAVRAWVTASANAGRVPLLVAYNIPQRDCGGLSGGNSTSADAYRRWIAAFAAGIAGRRAVVILEPDALAAMGCLSSADQALRIQLLRYAVATLAQQAGAVTYLDAGHAEWQPASTMAARLTQVGLANVAGFFLNVSNFIGTAANVTYGNALSALVGGKHYVIDTGRNGLGPTTDRQWCNPGGRALGERPTSATGQPLVDAYLWVKVPGESDGACDGAPPAGSWMPEYALGLAQRAAW